MLMLMLMCKRGVQIIAGLVVSLLAVMVSIVANVVVHISANEKMRFVCYRHVTRPVSRACLPPCGSWLGHRCWVADRWVWRDAGAG
jgi:hypothetical protein